VERPSWGRARSPPHNKLDVLWNGHLGGGLEAHPTINLMYCGTGILPVLKIVQDISTTNIF
ncbi:hypothetical protein, partial [Tychonema sp. LEGE 07203]|uniref:hypothetical protein n=1 Tax=Tychonema sp. LEGE 07203 TaxID=1828671 RepID=UPI001D15B06A